MPPRASIPWQPEQFTTKTCLPRVASPAVAVAGAADGVNGCHFANPKVARVTVTSRSGGPI
jgi:hypothetical protein